MIPNFYQKYMIKVFYKVNKIQKINQLLIIPYNYQEYMEVNTI